MIFGRLQYNEETGRFEIVNREDGASADLHAGQALDVAVKKEWVPTHIKYNWQRQAWYLVGINRTDIDGLIARAAG